MEWQVLLACFLVITGITIYFPIIYIRKMDRVLEVLDRIERNTRDAVRIQDTETVVMRGVLSDREGT